MTLLTKRALVGVSTPNPAPNHRLSGALFAGEALDTADACTLRDGRVYRASGAAADGNARIFGWTAAPASAGEAVTLYDHVTIEYSTGLSMGTLFYLSGDTPGGLDTDPSPGGAVPCAVALDSTRVHVVSTWGGGAGSGGGAESPSYLELPAISAPDPLGQPVNTAWVYLDAADTALKMALNGTVAPLGGGAALDAAQTWTAQQTFQAAPDTAPVLVATQLSNPTGYPPALILYPLLGGTDSAAAGLGTGIVLQLPGADGNYFNAVRASARWTDAVEATASSRLELALTRNGSDEFSALTIRPEGLEIPLIPAPAGNPPADRVWLYADSADSHIYKKLADGTTVDLG